MIYLQLALLLLIALISIYRPAAIVRWDRFKKAKMFLIASVAIEPIFIVLAAPVEGRAAAFPGTLARASALECGCTALAVAFFLFSLKAQGEESSGDQG